MRERRIITEVGIYHIYLRGNSRFVIFYDDEDRNVFYSHIEKSALKHNVQLFAYVLMDNHVHLLAKSNNLSAFISSILVCYVKWYNRKHKSSGNLFSSPYSSAPKNSMQKFRNCLIYILLNPVEAGIVKNAIEYRWSSAELYFNEEKCRSSKIKVDTEFVKLLFESESNFLAELKSSDFTDGDIKEEKEIRILISYADLNKVLQKQLAGRFLKELSRQELRVLANNLKSNTRASYIQIANMLHVSYGFVRNG